MHCQSTISPKISLLTTNLLIGEGQYIKAHNNKAKLADL